MRKARERGGKPHEHGVNKEGGGVVSRRRAPRTRREQGASECTTSGSKRGMSCSKRAISALCGSSLANGAFWRSSLLLALRAFLAIAF